MDCLRIFAICVITLTLSNCAVKRGDDSVDKELNFLLEQKQYFALDRELNRNENKISENRKLYYKAFLAKAFGKSSTSNRYIENILNEHKNKFNDTLIVKLLDLKATNHIYENNYGGAAETYERILNDYFKVLDSTETSSYSNVKKLFEAIAEVKPMMMQPHKTVKINSYRNNFNHLMTPVMANNVTEHFIFDTGANLSTISESQAKKMDLEIIEKNIDVGSSTKINVKSRLAVAKNFYIGDILFNNIIFLVMPDAQLTFPDIDYQIKGIIGFPVIKQLEEIHLHKNGNITIPDVPKKSTLRNMVLEGLNPVVELSSGNETLLFTLDTGAKNSELSFKYYLNHKSFVENSGELMTKKRGGAGGMTDVNEYMLKNFPLKFGTKSIELKEMHVAIEEYGFNKYFDGNLGQDVFLESDLLILNFKDMYIDLK